MNFLHLILLENQNNCSLCGVTTRYIKDHKNESYVNNETDYKKAIANSDGYASCVPIIKRNIK